MHDFLGYHGEKRRQAVARRRWRRQGGEGGECRERQSGPGDDFVVEASSAVGCDRWCVRWSGSRVRSGAVSIIFSFFSFFLLFLFLNESNRQWRIQKQKVLLEA
jgi:hypothetical protein